MLVSGFEDGVLSLCGRILCVSGFDAYEQGDTST